MDKIAHVERIEDKLRRRDLLVDEETLYQFYDKRFLNTSPAAKRLKTGAQR